MINFIYAEDGFKEVKYINVDFDGYNISYAENVRNPNYFNLIFTQLHIITTRDLLVGSIHMQNIMLLHIHPLLYKKVR